MNIFEKNLRRVDGVQQRHNALAFPFAVTKKFGDDNGGALVSQLAFSMFLTVFPLLLLVVTILGIVLADHPGLRQSVLNSTFGEFPIVGRQLSSNIHALHRSSILGLIIGIVSLIYGASSMAGTALYAMSQVWDIPNADRPNYWKRMARSLLFLVVLAVGLILTTALSGFGTFGKHNIALGILGEILAGLLNIGMFFLAFRVLTPHSISTKKLFPGVVVGGIAWTILQAVGGYVVGHDLKGASAVYGLFGLVLGLSAWLVLSCQILIYSAEINTVLADHLWPRSMVTPPLTKADQISLNRQATEGQRRPDQSVASGFQGAAMTEDEYRQHDFTIDPQKSGLSSKVPDDEVDV